MSVTTVLQELSHDALRQKKIAQAVGKFAKTSLIKRLVELAESIDDVAGPCVFISVETVYVTVTMNKLEGFKDARLAGILQAIEYLNPVRTDMDEYATSYQKEFKYSFPGTYDADNEVTPVARFVLRAYIKSDSATCRREVVGMTAPTPQPIYKLVCDDNIAPSESNQVEEV